MKFVPKNLRTNEAHEVLYENLGPSIYLPFWNLKLFSSKLFLINLFKNLKPSFGTFLWHANQSVHKINKQTIVVTVAKVAGPPDTAENYQELILRNLHPQNLDLEFYAF